jgi:hypothetical protein
MTEQYKFTDEADAALIRVRDQTAWIRDHLEGIELKGDHRHRIPGQLFDLAIEHGTGILYVLSVNIFASAFALVRCEFECFLRGIWLHYCATDEEIDAFIEKDQIAIHLGDLIVAIEKQPPFSGRFLSSIKKNGWKALNGYTHGGIHQISRRMQGEFIEPAFEESSIIEVINFSSTMALLAFGQIASMAGRDDLVAEADSVICAGMNGGIGEAS